jgi:hypothetical protein
MAEGDGRLMNLEVASGVRELALENGARRQATAKTIDASVELVDYDTNHRKLLADMERMESEKVEARRERKVEAEKSEADERSRQERVEAAGARREVEERVAAEKAERREVPETEEHIYESRMFLVKGKKGEVCSDANTAHGVENGSTTERLTKGSIHEVGMREDQQVALTHGDNQQLGHQQTDRAEGVESVHVARPADAEAPASSSRVKPVAFEAIEAEGAHGAVQRAPTDQRQVQGDEGAPAYHAERPTTAGESSALTAPETSTQAEEFTLENLHDVERDETISKAPRAAHGKKVNDAQMRAFLLQQLMDQHATKARREKILKALIALGISEVEYRKLLLKLGEMDAARLAEQVAARATIAQPIAMTTDAPAMRENADTVIEKPSAQPVQTRAQTTRAALYKRLKEEGGAPARK